MSAGKNKKPRFQDYMQELAGGMAWGVFIDDTGSPGIQDAPNNYHPERKTWVAVLVPPAQMREVMVQMPAALEELKESVGADEFHFTEIYSGKKQFKGVDLQVRLNLFVFMAKIFTEYRFPILVQTFDPETLADVQSRSNGQLPDSIPPFDLTSCNDLALFFLLIQVKGFLQETEMRGKNARVFIDEGFKKQGIALRIPSFENVFADSQICFADSSSIFPIQLADFAAFSLNRVQLIGGKQDRGSLDNEVLRILSPIAFNYVNIKKTEVSLDREGPLMTLADSRPNGPHPTAE